MRTSWDPATRALLVATLLAGCGCSREAAQPAVSEPVAQVRFQPADPPAAAGAMAPHLSVAASGALLTWLEPLASEDAAGEAAGHRLRLARFDGAAWSEPQELASGDGFFANWADVPAVAQGPQGVLVAHWLDKLGGETYAYGVQLVRSGDGGATWQRLGLLHDDASPVEHGFVSWVPTAGGVQAFWLDGRAMGGHSEGAMQLRTLLLDGGSPGASTLLDDRVCDCCQTGAALTSSGPIVAYRDRGPSEIRDVSIIRAEGDGWSEPVALADDGWEIHGCPVNGPAVAADGERVAVAWFTAAAAQPRVKVAFSADAGKSFGPPVVVDAEQPLGRVDLALDPAGDAWVSWMAAAGERAEVRLRRFSATGEAGAPEVVAETSAKRSAGVPRVVLAGGRLAVVWVEDAEPSRLRMVTRPVG